MAEVTRCMCGLTHDAEAWHRLEYAGLQDDGEQVREFRKCVCGLPLATVVGAPPKKDEPYDLAPSSSRIERRPWRVRIESGADPVTERETEYASQAQAVAECKSLVMGLDPEYGGRVVLVTPEGREIVSIVQAPRLRGDA